MGIIVNVSQIARSSGIFLGAISTVWEILGFYQILEKFHIQTSISSSHWRYHICGFINCNLHSLRRYIIFIILLGFFFSSSKYNKQSVNHSISLPYRFPNCRFYSLANIYKLVSPLYIRFNLCRISLAHYAYIYGYNPYRIGRHQHNYI